MVWRLVPVLTNLYRHPYNRARPFSALYRFAAWQWRKRLGNGPWDEHLWDGRRRVRFFPDSRESMFLAYHHVMDWPEFNFMSRYLRPADTALDVGANIGIYVLWISQFIAPPGRVVAFEPDAENHRRLRAQLALNKLAWVETHATAVADRDGEVAFSAGKDLENHILADPSPAVANRVSCTTLDTFAERSAIGTIAFAKIDVEGAELFVLRGAAGLMAAQRITVMQLEFNHQAEKFGLHGEEVIGLLEQHGYALYEYDTRCNAMTAIDAPGGGHCNLFALADVAAVNGRLQASRA